MSILNISQELSTLTYLVYIPSSRPVSKETVHRLYQSWVATHTTGFLQAGLDRPPEVEFGVPSNFPALPRCQCNPACVELARKSRQARRVCRLERTYRPGWPHLGYWSVLGAASALAEKVDGFIVELGHRDEIPPYVGRSDGSLKACEHVRIHCSLDELTGKGWATTQGLKLFGLRELQFVDIPGYLLLEVARLLNPVADRLLSSSGPIPQLVDLRTPEAGGLTRVRLVPGALFTTVRPPAPTSMRRWYEQMLLDLYGV